MKYSTVNSVVFGIVGLIFIITGVVFCFLWPHFYGIFDDIFNNRLILMPTSHAFDVWKGINDNPKIIEVYFFNWTNPEELKVLGKKPNFVEVGPYRYIEKIERVNITFHSENSTMSYDELKYWYFDIEKSTGRLDDKIVQLNIQATTAAHNTEYLSRNDQNKMLRLFEKLSNLTSVITVNEFLFAAYKDSSTSNYSTFDGHFNIGTGVDGLQTLGVIKTWNYQNTTSYYKSPCNRVEESVDESWPPNRDSPKDITKWAVDFCRPVTYEYTGVATHYGILGYQYSIGEKTLGNSTKRRYAHDQAKYFEKTTTTKSNENFDDPDTINMGRCYCNGDCSPMGLINVTACTHSAPRLISLPHFYKGDPILREQVTGMNPNERDHSSYITLESNTGFPLDVAARFQINVLLQPSLIIPLFKDVPKIYFPVLWYNEKSGITEDLSWNLHKLLILPEVVFYGSIALIIVGTLIIVIIIIIQCIQNSRSHKLEIAGNKIGICCTNKIGALHMKREILANERYYNDRLI